MRMLVVRKLIATQDGMVADLRLLFRNSSVIWGPAVLCLD